MDNDSPSLTTNHVPVESAHLRCELVRDWTRLQELMGAWKRLWESDSKAEIFQTPEWAIAWWRCFGHAFELCSLVVFAADEVVGIVPLVKGDGLIQFLGTPEADYADIICEEKWAPAVLRVALETLQESVSDWNECVWQHLSKQSRVMRHYLSLPRPVRRHLHCLPTEQYQAILLDNDRENVFRSLLGKKHTRRRRNKIQKAGEVRFRHLDAQQAAEGSLDDFFHYHVRRHVAIGKVSAYSDPEACQFIRTLFAELGPAVRFGVLELDGRPLAWHFGFEANGKFLLYQHTFDLEASRYTPGELLMWNLFEYAQDHVSREFDFGKGNELYKNRYANSSRETFSLFVEPRGLGGRIRGLGRSVQAHLAPPLWEIQQMAKSHATTLRAFRSVRRWLMRTSGGARPDKKQAAASYGAPATVKERGNPVWGTRPAEVFASETPQPGIKAR